MEIAGPFRVKAQVEMVLLTELKACFRQRVVVLVDHVFAQGNVFPLLGDDALAGIVVLVDRLAAL